MCIGELKKLRIFVRSPDIAFGSSGERAEDYILHSAPRLTATSQNTGFARLRGGGVPPRNLANPPPDLRNAKSKHSCQKMTGETI